MTHEFKNSLKLLHLNVQSLSKKRNLLVKYLEKFKPYVLVLSEHWLLDSEITVFNLPGYLLATHFCRKAKNGGVAIFVKNCINVEVSSIENLKELSVSKVIEIAACKIIISNEIFVIVGMYRVPNTNLQIFDNVLCQLLTKTRNLETIILGDFNVNFLDNSIETQQIVNQMGTFGFKQMINEYTRIAPSQRGISKTCIDNIFTNSRKQSITNVSDCHFSDHRAQILEIKVTSRINSMVTSENRKINEDTLYTLRAMLSNEMWHETYSQAEPDRATEEFLLTFNHKFQISCPKVTSKVNRKRKNLWDPRIGQLEAAITILKHELQNTPEQQPALLQQIKEHRKAIKTLHNDSMKIQLSNQILESNNPIKTTWRIINELRTGEPASHERIMLKKDGGYVTCPNTVANMFNVYYKDLPINVTKDMQKSDFQFDLLKKVDASLFLYPCTEIEVQKIITSMSNKNSAGMDEISNRILKCTKDSIIAPLTYIFNLAMERGTFPLELKKSIIKPLYKKKDKTKTENYRPIALNSTISKVLERIFLNRALPFWQKHKVIADNQFGYKSDSSTIDAVIQTLGAIHQSQNDGKMVMAVFLDLSKAFDCVDHATLLQILEIYGIRGLALEFIRSYLSERKQCVKIDSYKNNIRSNCLSEAIDLHNYSVPQGSELGPYLFNIYTNATQKLIENLGSKATIYVDDTTILIEGNSVLDLVDKVKTILLKIREYFVSLNLLLNFDKTVILIFGQDESMEIEIDKKFLLKTVSSSKFLGIEIQQNLEWKTHIDSLISTICKNLFVLDQLSNSITAPQLVKSYYAFIHSHLSYGTVIWALNIPDQVLHDIFKLQKTAIRIIKYGSRRIVTCRGIFKELKILTVISIYILQNAVYAKRKLSHITNDMYHNYETRNKKNIHLQFPVKSVQYIAGKIFNKFPLAIRNLSTTQFKNRVKKWLVKKEFYDMDEFWESSCDEISL